MSLLRTLCPSCLARLADFAIRVVGEMGPQIMHRFLPLNKTVDLLVKILAVRDETEQSAHHPHQAHPRGEQKGEMSWSLPLFHLLPVPLRFPTYRGRPTKQMGK